MNEGNAKNLAPGTILGGNYQIIKMIGQGGMGSVYMAYDMQLDLQVAVKVISPEFSGTMEEPELESILKRFASEAKIAAKIEHPNVIRIYGFKREKIESDGVFTEIDYLVMELLCGRSLRNTMDVSGFEDEAEIRNWINKYMIPILDGLQKVHECGIIHRDIKPENFLMKEDVPKLADFGLSKGFDFPAVTGSVADIFGTVPYMAPEQFYNFSLAREAADVYSIGKILYEMVEGKMSEKVKPFKQAKLSHPETGFLKALDQILRDATAENPNDRIDSVEILKTRLTELVYQKGSPQERRVREKTLVSLKMVIMVLVFSAAMGAIAMHLAHRTEILPEADHSAHAGDSASGPVAAGEMKPVSKADDDSILHLIPRKGKSIPGVGKPPGPFYLSESPVTNQQYVTFLNEIIDRVTVKSGEIHIDDRPTLGIDEKIRGYKPIEYDGKQFRVSDPMHSACSVLLVTGYGAESYARHYGLRLPRIAEWIFVKQPEEKSADRPMSLPAPAINYEQDRYGLRGINRLAEWGKTETGEFVVLGQAPSGMTQSDYILGNDPGKYYTDTGFRVARDANFNNSSVTSS